MTQWRKGKAEGLLGLSAELGILVGCLFAQHVKVLLRPREPTGPDGEKPELPPLAMALHASALEWILAESWL